MSFIAGKPPTIILQKGEGQSAGAPGHFNTTFKLTSQQSGNQFGFYEVDLWPGSITSAHLHHKVSEIFYILHGELELLAGTQRFVGKEGSFVSVPPETAHAFANLTTDPVKFLIVFYPGIDREKYYEGIAEIMRNRPPNAKELRAALDAQFDNIRLPDIAFP